MAFTKDQQLAIDMEGNNIIVSAGAGSGKTAVLTERVIRKLKSGVDIDKLLVLTFTNEAANEMKERIRNAIISNKLDRQLGLIDSSYITTFDSFALSIVKKYHYLLNISKDVGIADENIITIYKHKVLDEIFLEMYNDPLFINLISEYSIKDDRNIHDYIINLSNKLDLLLDKDKYLDEYLDKYYGAEYINECVNNYMMLIKKKITELYNNYEALLSYASDNLIKKLDNWFNPLFKGNSYEEYKLFTTMESVKFIGLEAEGHAIRDNIKENIKDINCYLRFANLDEVINTYKSTYNNTLVIIKIVKELNRKVLEYKTNYELNGFNDIAHMAIDVIKENDDIREELKNYFNEIMIDEYQDTSNIQEEFISLISNNNVYMVGDIKQSIYRFRNANPYIFKNKYDSYSNNCGGKKIDLLKNFRSRKETLFNINEIFNLIMDDEIGNANYIESHNMVYGNTLYDEEDTLHDNNMEIYNYSMEDKSFKPYEKELFIISEDIKEKIDNHYKVFDKNTKKIRDLKYSDICIITDKNAYLNTYKKILEYNKIPSVLYKNEELNNNDVIMALKSLFSLVYLTNMNIFDNKFRYAFISVARSFLFRLSDEEIYQILTNKKYFDNEIIKIVKEINIFDPLPLVIRNIICEFNVYEKLTIINNIEENIVRIDNLLDIADNLNNIGYNMEEFINYLEDISSLGLSIEYSLNVSNGNAVKIMNIHKSKGLEFSLCYFTGMNDEFMMREISEKMAYSTKYGIIIPYVINEEENDTFIKDLYKDNYLQEEVSEKIRLLYVALTRAREKMIILANLDNERDSYGNLVPTSKRLNYRSFLDILNSLNVIDKYTTNKEGKYTDKYKYVNVNSCEKSKQDIKIINKEINISYDKQENKKFSKKHKGIISMDDLKKMEYGTKIHEMMEYASFSNPTNKYVINLLKKIPNNFINVYKEYEFVYNKDNTKYHGIIDLMLEYNDYITIIDYKLKNIKDKEYFKQLKGYQEYISFISNKPVKIYLYSLMDDILEELDEK